MSKEIVSWEEKLDEWTAAEIGAHNDGSQTGKHVVCMDFGMKWNIPRHFASRGNRVTIVPGTTTADEILALEADGILISPATFLLTLSPTVVQWEVSGFYR